MFNAESHAESAAAGSGFKFGTGERIPGLINVTGLKKSQTTEPVF